MSLDTTAEDRLALWLHNAVLAEGTLLAVTNPYNGSFTIDVADIYEVMHENRKLKRDLVRMRVALSAPE